MAGFLADEIITPLADATSAICIAVDRSSNPNRSYYYQKIVDSQSLEEASLGPLAILHNITRTEVEQFYPNYHEYHLQIPPVLADRIPHFAIGSPSTSVIGLLFFVLYPYHIFRLIDTARHAILADHLLPHAQTVQFNTTSTRCFFTLTTGYSCFQIDNGLFPLFQMDLEGDSTIPQQATWCAQRWCIFQRNKSVWYLTLLDEQTGVIVDRIRLHGRPDTISAARFATVVACGLNKNRIQIIDIDTRRSMIVSHRASNEPYNRMDVAVAPDGLRIAARGTYDQRLWCVGCGGDTLTELMPLPDMEVALNTGDFLIYRPGFCLLNNCYLTLSLGQIVSCTSNLPAVATGRW
jgi:hypothetical protein